MACRLYGTKQLPEPVLTFVVNWMDTREKLQNTKIFIQENANEIVVCKMVAILFRSSNVDISSILYAVTTVTPVVTAANERSCTQRAAHRH